MTNIEKHHYHQKLKDEIDEFFPSDIEGLGKKKSTQLWGADREWVHNVAKLFSIASKRAITMPDVVHILRKNYEGENMDVILGEVSEQREKIFNKSARMPTNIRNHRTEKNKELDALLYNRQLKAGFYRMLRGHDATFNDLRAIIWYDPKTLVMLEGYIERQEITESDRGVIAQHITDLLELHEAYAGISMQIGIAIRETAVIGKNAPLTMATDLRLIRAARVLLETLKKRHPDDFQLLTDKKAEIIESGATFYIEDIPTRTIDILAVCYHFSNHRSICPQCKKKDTFECKYSALRDGRYYVNNAPTQVVQPVIITGVEEQAKELERVLRIHPVNEHGLLHSQRNLFVKFRESVNINNEDELKPLITYALDKERIYINDGMYHAVNDAKEVNGDV